VFLTVTGSTPDNRMRHPAARPRNGRTMGNTQKDASVPARPRRAARREHAPRVITPGRPTRSVPSSSRAAHAVSRRRRLTPFSPLASSRLAGYRAALAVLARARRLIHRARLAGYGAALAVLARARRRNHRARLAGSRARRTDLSLALAGLGIALGGLSADPADPRAALIRNRMALARIRVALLGARIALAVVVTLLAVAAAISLAAGTLRAATRYAAELLWDLVPSRTRARAVQMSARGALAAVIVVLSLAVAVGVAAEMVQGTVSDRLNVLRASIPEPIRVRCRSGLAAADRASTPARARIRTAARAAGRAVTPVVLSVACTIRAAGSGLSGAIPARAKAPVAAAAVVALASTATAAATAIGPAAIAGPAGPAIAAAAIGSAPAGAARVAPPTSASATPARGLAAAAAAIAAPYYRSASGQHAGVSASRAGHARRVLDLSTWHAINEAAAGHPHGGVLAPEQKLLPAGLYGTQASMVITPARAANAALITGQALRLHMGIRSAVIAVATAMQESTLENLSYGDRDSLGLFQQRPSAGWGTAAQITDPAYAADAFLRALGVYQAHDPVWARQPLWQAAQGVQRSAFPTAYAQWEDQAAHIVATATRHLL
jgi:hypothetical protein